MLRSLPEAGVPAKRVTRATGLGIFGPCPPNRRLGMQRIIAAAFARPLRVYDTYKTPAFVAAEDTKRMTEESEQTTYRWQSTDDL